VIALMWVSLCGRFQFALFTPQRMAGLFALRQL